MNFHSLLCNVQYVHVNNNKKVNYQVSIGNTDITVNYSISSPLGMCVFFPLPVVYARSELLSPSGTSPIVLFSTEYTRLKGQISQGKWSGLHSSLESALLGPPGGLLSVQIASVQRGVKENSASREKQSAVPYKSQSLQRKVSS